MKLEKWALIAEIIGAVAIVFSLLFVGLQVRYSNTLAATESLREGTQLWVGEYKRSFGTDELTAFMRRGMNDYYDLDDDEKGRFFGSMMGFLTAYDTIYNQYEGGLLREDVFVSIALGYYGLLEMPGARQVLEEEAIALPQYLLDYTAVDVLVGREDELADARLTFLQTD